MASKPPQPDWRSKEKEKNELRALSTSTAFGFRAILLAPPLLMYDASFSH